MKLSEKRQTASEGRKCKHLYKPSIFHENIQPFLKCKTDVHATTSFNLNLYDVIISEQLINAQSYGLMTLGLYDDLWAIVQSL